MISPSTNQLRYAPFQHSTSYPTCLLPNSPGPDIIEDTTLLYLPPSCGDLTAFASGWNNSLVSSTPQLLKRNKLPFVHVIDTPLKQANPPIDTLQSSSETTRFAAQSGQGRNSFPIISSTVDLVSFSHTSNAELALRSHATSFLPTDVDAEMNVSPPRSYVWPTHSLTSNLSSFIKAQSVSSYHIIGTLGRGTYGKVVLAYLEGRPDGDLYAVKVVRKANHYELGSELAILQTISELSASKTHGCVDEETGGLRFLQRLLSNFQDATSIYIILEYHPTTLSDPETANRFLLQEGEHPGLSASVSLPLTFTGRPPASNSCDESIVFLRLLTAEISLGLLFIHREGIVHQDIKTANIMISFAGHAVIGDFGAASKLPRLSPGPGSCSPTSCSPRSRKFGQIVLHPDDFITFTPLYAAPELRERSLDGVVVYDERSDWWSLGVLLYELATGSVPFNTSGGTDVLRRGRRSDGHHSLAFGALEKLSVAFEKANRDWFPSLTSFLRALLVHDPNDRLTGDEVQKHLFFEPIQELWDDIADLKYPPCPNPPTSHVDDDISFTLDLEDSVVPEPGPHGTCSAQGSHFSNERFNEPDTESNVFLDNFGTEMHSTIQIGVQEPWRPRGRFLEDEEDDWDIRSVAQPMPSSASIWDRLFEEVQDSGLYIPGGTIQLTSSLSRHHLGPLLPSAEPQSPLASLPYVSTPDFISQHYAHPVEDDFKEPEPILQYAISLSELVVQEKITLSLLEAMDIRDRHSALPVGQQPKTPTFNKGHRSRKLVKRTIRRLWRNLCFW
ncbi:Ribosomal protein S6 kinase alpha-5 [Hypsizygus marmoreus]|uniref:non-specific serine/threonine protein kinase n=1 Tax=Hypsizygus marmoreus TaxID=39966 RepID=A0A369JLU3_HYPMA|nr:Ribosomal protein S6 kinase alpha-5 [Hypsizygus marmoreus]